MYLSVRLFFYMDLYSVKVMNDNGNGLLLFLLYLTILNGNLLHTGIEIHIMEY